jgi:predicted transport protein
MKLFQINNNQLSSISSNPFKLEKDIQALIENNVDGLFELEFVKSELSVQNFRFDTLCFDNDTNSFVIIEYKKGTSYSVIDQGYTYLSLLLNNKSDFILEYNETLGKNIKRDEVDWSQSRIIFISPKFSDYQKNSINFKNIPFELWEVMRYKNNILGLNKITTESDVDINATITNEGGNSVVKQVSKEIIRYDENYHLTKSKNRPDWVVELYRELKERILNIGDGIEVRIGKQTIGFKQNKVFTDVIIYNKGLGVMMNMKKGQLKDDLSLTEDLSEKGHWGNGDYRIWLHSDEHLDYTISLIKQSYQHQLT